MPRYMTQFSYTQQAWAALTQNPQDRSQQLASLLENAGGRLISLDYSMGDYDGVIITEAPDDVTLAAVVSAAMSPGHVRVTKTTKLMSPQEMMEAWQKAKEWTYSGVE